ncbi:MAG: ImuA family protein, partial [Planctomycetota bacterium]
QNPINWGRSRWEMAMRTPRLKELQTAIHAIEGGWYEAGGTGPGGTHSWCVPPKGVHEWFGVAHAAHNWAPPLGILLHLALRSLEGSPGCVVWIGRRCWPYPHVLNGAGLRRSIFVDPPDGASRLWTIDLAARCPGVAAVVADGSGLDMAATRRLQLSAEAGSALVLCARPPNEVDRLSAAATRWRVRCAPATGRAPRWIVELLRCKGVQPESEVLRTVEWKGAPGGVVVHAALVDRPDPAEQPQAGARARRSA